MTLAGGLIYYGGSFIVIVACAVAGVFLGKNLKKRKTEKELQEKESV